MPNINGLPPEILSLIFMSFYQDLKGGEVDIGLAAVCLTCKHWNDLALSTPELWSSIEIISDPIHTLPISTLPSYSKVSTWLDRSQNWPLSLAVRGEQLNPIEFTSIKPILPLLVAHSHRWRRLSLGFGFWFQPMHFHLPHTFIAPILESVEVICDSHLWDHIFHGRLLRGCPALRSYTSNQRGNYLTELPFDDLPWEQLRNLEVANPTTATKALMLLERAVNLHSCCLTIGLDLTTGRDSLKPVTSPIKFLTMNIHGGMGYGRDAKIFFRSLDACNLTSLSIGLLLGHSITHGILFDILSKPRLRLSSLTIGNLEISEDELLDCLTLLSESITTLEILGMSEVPINGAVKNKTINLLTFHGEGSPKPLFPFLEILALELCVGAGDGLLARMVRSRRRSLRTLRDYGIALLKRVDVVFVHSTHRLDDEGLKKMYGEGLQGRVKFQLNR